MAPKVCKNTISQGMLLCEKKDWLGKLLLARKKIASLPCTKPFIYNKPHKLEFTKGPGISPPSDDFFWPDPDHNYPQEILLKLGVNKNGSY